MFSDHLRKIDQAPHKTLLLVAAGLVIVCQLMAMALVAGEQVQKAQMRGNNDVSRQAAVASCVEASRGVEIKGCFLIGSSELEIQRDSLTHEARYEASSTLPKPSSANTGFMSVSLNTP